MWAAIGAVDLSLRLYLLITIRALEMIHNIIVSAFEA